MLRQMCRRGQLDALLRDKSSGDPEMRALCDALQPTARSSSDAAPQLTEEQVAHILAHGADIPDLHYTLIMAYLHSTGEHYRSVHDILNRRVPSLPPSGRKCTQFISGERTFSTFRSHDGNSAIQFTPHQSHISQTGWINSIWQIPLRGVVRTFFLVQVHRPLSPDQDIKGPYRNFPRFNIKLVDAEPLLFLQVIEPSQVITHVVCHKREKGTYGIDRPFVVVCTSLNRGRK
jgi:hypothetical protein